MDTFTITGKTPANARALYDALAEFHPDLVEHRDGRNHVIVEMGGDCDIVAVLNAIENFVTALREGPARIEFHGHEYAVHPRPPDLN